MKVILFLALFVFFNQKAFADVSMEECVKFAQSKDKDKAFDCAHKLTIISKDKVQAYVFQGSIYSIFSEYEKAIQSYSHVIKINPKNAGVYSLRGGVYLRLERYQEAAKDMSSAIMFNTIDDNVYIASLYLQRAGIYQKLESMQKAINDYKKGESILDKVSDTQWQLKDAMIPKQDKFSTKDANIKNALYIDVYFGLCSANIALSKLKDATPYCEKVHELDNKSVINKMNLSACYIDIKKFNEAKTILDSVPSVMRESNFYIVMNYAALYANMYFDNPKQEYKDTLNKYLQIGKALIKGKSERDIYLHIQKEIEEKAMKRKN